MKCPAFCLFFFLDQCLLHCSWDMNSANRQMNSNQKLFFYCFQFSVFSKINGIQMHLKVIQIKCLHITTNTRQDNTRSERKSPHITINTKQKFHHRYGFGLEQRERERERGKRGQSLRSWARCRSKKAVRV